MLPSVGDKTPKFRFRGELYSEYFPSSFMSVSAVYVFMNYVI